MSKTTQNDTTATLSRRWKQKEERLFPDRGNMPKPRWRDALKQLAGPAVRVHKYRNLRSAMFYDAMCDYDCGKPS